MKHTLKRWRPKPWKMCSSNLDGNIRQPSGLQTNRFVSSGVFTSSPQKKLWEFIRGTLKCPHFVQDGYHDLFCVLGGGESKSAIVFW